MPTLDDLRRDIDRVDEVLVRLLNERARCVCEIGKLKKVLGVEVYQPDREKKVIEHVRNIAIEGPLGPDAIARLFERIIDEARGLERRAMHEEPDVAAASAIPGGPGAPGATDPNQRVAGSPDIEQGRDTRSQGRR